MAEATENKRIAVQLSGVKKMYKLGQIGGKTLRADLQSWWALKRGKEDPNSKIGEQRLYGQTFMALNGIDLTVYQGEAIGIIGGNGAGKSTLLKLLSRVTAPTEGTIDIYGRIASMLEVGTGFNGEMTGRENVYMNGAILGMTKAEIDAKMEDIIEFSECRDFIDTPVKRYSSGMYVKLAFSVAAHLDSEIMIMDEVLAVGDMAFQKKCLDKMREAAKKDGRTVLYVSHNMNTIRQLCDRCIVLEKGRMVFDGDVESAIDIYIGGAGSEYPIQYDLEQCKRPSDNHGKRIRLTEFRFLNKMQAVFKRTEPIRFELELKAIDDIQEIKLYYVLYSRSGECIGLAQTYEPVTDVKQGNTYICSFEFDPSNLAEDVYYFVPDIFIDNGKGKHLSVDHPMCNIFFKVVDDDSKGLTWELRYFGHIRFNEIKKISKEQRIDVDKALHDCNV